MSRRAAMVWDNCGFRFTERDEKVKYKHRFERPKPPTGWYSYSNEASQGALICETPGFPAGHNDDVDVHCAYSDRICQWDRERYLRACKIAGGGDQSWGSCLRAASAKTLKEFAVEALNLPSSPMHVRVIHYYNVATGYSCPVVMAICEKHLAPATS